MNPLNGKKNKQKKNYLGNHLIAEFWNGKVIEDEKLIKEILFEAAIRSKNIPLKFVYHKFRPQGATGVVLLQESHIAFHGWPEFNYLAIDIFTCGDKTFPKKALEYLRDVFQPQKTEIREVGRGLLKIKKR